MTKPRPGCPRDMGGANFNNNFSMYNRTNMLNNSRRFRENSGVFLPEDLIQKSKELVSIPDAWRHLRLPGEPARMCRSPFRSDEKPSFSIFNDGRAFKDHGDPDSKGDLYQFVMKARNCDFVEARDIIFGWCGFAPGRRDVRTSAPVRAVPSVSKWKPKPPPKNLRCPTDTELKAYLTQRRLGDIIEGARELCERGVFLSGAWGDLVAADTSSWCDVPVFIVADDRRENFMVRRQDGVGWRCLQGAKNRPWVGREGISSWPIGVDLLAETFADAPAVLLVEGFPDFVAAHVAAHAFYGSATAMKHLAIVAMYSATPAIHAEALPLFKGRHVRIVYHTGDKGADGRHDAFDLKREGAGIRAADKWGAQLIRGGALVDHYPLSFAEGVGDLNDAVSRVLAGDPCTHVEGFSKLFEGLPATMIEKERAA